jgi:hypothetical protein
LMCEQGVPGKSVPNKIRSGLTNVCMADNVVSCALNAVS